MATELVKPTSTATKPAVAAESEKSLKNEVIRARITLTTSLLDVVAA